MITFDAIRETYVTFAAASGLAVGDLCKPTANGTVGACEEDDEFIGVVGSVRNGVAGVVMGGFVTLPYSGTAPSLGYNLLLADGDGGVAVGETGRSCCVVELDTTAKTVGLFL